MNILNGIILLIYFCILDSKCWVENKKNVKEVVSKIWISVEKKLKYLFCCQFIVYIYQELKLEEKVLYF